MRSCQENEKTRELSLIKLITISQLVIENSKLVPEKEFLKELFWETEILLIQVN